MILSLLYHKIDRHIDTRNSDLFVSPDSFERQVRFLKKRGYVFLGAKDLLDFLELGKPLSKKNVIITFDDGYLDNMTNALPILNRYNAKCIIFLTTEFIGKSTMWNGIENHFLDISQIIRMDASGIDFGSHTLTHPSLPGCPIEKIIEEVSESKIRLEELLNHSIDIFAYPYGSYNQAIRKAVIEAGYKCAFSLHRGVSTKKTDPFALRRIRMGNSFSGFLFFVYFASLIEKARIFKRA
jgi:peptidoglycan/xylan/chitin deacetylase (PgdA/CDA1 family)